MAEFLQRVGAWWHTQRGASPLHLLAEVAAFESRRFELYESRRLYEYLARTDITTATFNLRIYVEMLRETRHREGGFTATDLNAIRVSERLLRQPMPSRRALETMCIVLRELRFKFPYG